MLSVSRNQQMYYLNLVDFGIELEVLPVINYSGITINNFTIVVTVVSRERAATSIIA